MAAAAPSLVRPAQQAGRPADLEVETTSGEAATAEPKKKRGKLVLLVALVLAIAGTAGFMLTSTAEEAAAGEPVPGEVVPVGQMTVNLANGESRYARLTLSVLLAEGFTKEDVSARFPLLQEGVLRTVSGFTPAEIRDAGGFDALSSQLTARAQEIYPDGQVIRVVLTELLVQ